MGIQPTKAVLWHRQWVVKVGGLSRKKLEDVQKPFDGLLMVIDPGIQRSRSRGQGILRKEKDAALKLAGHGAVQM